MLTNDMKQQDWFDAYVPLSTIVWLLEYFYYVLCGNAGTGKPKLYRAFGGNAGICMLTKRLNGECHIELKNIS